MSGHRIRRLVGVAASVPALLVGLIAMPSAPSALAAPTRDLQQVANQVRDLQNQAAAAHEDVTAAKDKLAGVQDELRRIQDRRDREKDQMRQTMSTLDDLARSVYLNGGVDPTLQVLLADDPIQFLAQAAVIDQLSQVQLAQLRSVQTSRLRLAQTEAEIADREAIAKNARDEMAAAEAQMQDRLKQAEDLLAGLQQAERERIARLQAEHRQQQAEAARRAAAQAAATAGQAGAGYAGGSRAQKVIQYALSQVGDPYSYSANPPSSWDCSKLTAAAWAQAGVGLTALSYTQYSQTRRVPVSEIQPGDLVFYFGGGAHHVGLYIGGGKMVHAANPSDGVEITNFLGPWYGSRFSGVGRVIG